MTTVQCKSIMSNSSSDETVSAGASDTFTVFMHRELVDALDEGFSPFDGIQAINDVFVGLPKVHRPKECKHPRHKSRKWLRLYRGRLTWYPLGFSYVQIGNELHIIQLFDFNDWRKSSHRDVDCIVSEPIE